jgi:hypothetical protein
MFSHQNLIYTPPMVHEESLVYPGPHHDDNFALSSSVATHYPHYTKVVFCGLNVEQFECAFANILPHWQLTHLSLQVLDDTVVKRIIDAANFTCLRQLILTNISHYSLETIYNKLHALTRTSSQVIKISCNSPEWQSRFNHLSEGRTTNLCFLEHIRHSNTELNVQVRNQKEEITRLQQNLRQLEKQRSKELASKDNKFETLRSNMAKEIETAKRKTKTARLELAGAAAKRDELESKNDLQTKALIKKSEHNAQLRTDLQGALGNNAALQSTISQQRDLRSKEKDIYAEKIENESILCEAIHLAILLRAISDAKKAAAVSKKRRYNSDSSSSSSNSESSDNDSSEASSAESSYSPSFFRLKLRRISPQYQLKQRYVLINQRP